MARTYIAKTTDQGAVLLSDRTRLILGIETGANVEVTESGDHIEIRRHSEAGQDAVKVGSAARATSSNTALIDVAIASHFAADSDPVRSTQGIFVPVEAFQLDELHDRIEEAMGDHADWVIDRMRRGNE